MENEQNTGRPLRGIADHFPDEQMRLNREKLGIYGMSVVEQMLVPPALPAIPETEAADSLFGKMVNYALGMGIAATKDGRLITHEEMYLPESPAAPDALDDFFADCWRDDGRPLPIETPVTAEMIEAGRCNAYGPGPGTFDFGAIYRAMKALEPVELVSEGERQAMQERDIMLRSLLAAQERENALRTELMAAHDMLAGVTAANVPDPPMPAPNPFRDFPSDPRRLAR